MKIYSAINTVIAIVATALISPIAVAAPHSASGIILTYDQDNNQKLSLEEFVDARRQRFAATDTNNNGTIEEDEYVYEWEGKMTTHMQADRKASVKQTHVRFNAIDKDEDGFISKAEMDAAGARGFAMMDHNEDGLVLASDPEPERKGGTTDDKPELRQRPMLRMPTTHNIEGFMELYDTNGDGRVDKAEFQAVRDEQFARTDENGDGRLTEQEYVLEFEDRLDAQYERTYQAQVKQTYVRFKVLDLDDDGHMTFNEYMQSGFRAFSRYDTTGDGFITVDDPAPEREQPAAPVAASQTASTAE